MKRFYIQPETETMTVNIEQHRLKPSYWKVDTDDKPIPISNDDDDDPTGAKGFDFSDDFE